MSGYRLCKPLCARFQGPDESKSPGRFRGLVWPAFGPRSKRRARTEKRQAESPDALLRRGSHFCPQCGQFQRMWFNAFWPAAG